MAKEPPGINPEALGRIQSDLSGFPGYSMPADSAALAQSPGVPTQLPALDPTPRRKATRPSAGLGPGAFQRATNAGTGPSSDALFGSTVPQPAPVSESRDRLGTPRLTPEQQADIQAQREEFRRKRAAENEAKRSSENPPPEPSSPRLPVWHPDHPAYKEAQAWSDAKEAENRTFEEHDNGQFSLFTDAETKAPPKVYGRGNDLSPEDTEDINARRAEFRRIRGEENNQKRLSLEEEKAALSAQRLAQARKLLNTGSANYLQDPTEKLKYEKMGSDTSRYINRFTQSRYYSSDVRDKIDYDNPNYKQLTLGSVLTNPKWWFTGTHTAGTSGGEAHRTMYASQGSQYVDSGHLSRMRLRSVFDPKDPGKPINPTYQQRQRERQESLTDYEDRIEQHQTLERRFGAPRSSVEGPVMFGSFDQGGNTGSWAGSDSGHRDLLHERSTGSAFGVSQHDRTVTGSEWGVDPHQRAINPSVFGGSPLAIRPPRTSQ